MIAVIVALLIILAACALVWTLPKVARDLECWNFHWWEGGGHLRGPWEPQRCPVCGKTGDGRG